jgi:hypothetical protein
LEFLIKVVPDPIRVNAALVKIEFRMDLDGVFLHAFFIMILGSISVGNSSGDFSYFLTKNCGQRRIIQDLVAETLLDLLSESLPEVSEVTVLPVVHRGSVRADHTRDEFFDFDRMDTASRIARAAIVFGASPMKGSL